VSESDPPPKYSGPNVTLPERASPYPVTRQARPITLVDHAREIERASASLAHQTNAQLRFIAEQIRWLQEQARRIVEEAAAHLDLHRTPCPFQRLQGHTYHLYRKHGAVFFSMLSPEDYGGHPPHEYLGSHRLEEDDSWTDVTHDRQPDE
jgi:hypothetical protein